MLDNELKSYLLPNLFNAAVRAGAAIMQVYKNKEDYDISIKSDKTPITVADRRAHETIKTYLGPTRIPILSEEGREMRYEERCNWELFWLVDPLDGTVEFIKGNNEFTVNIALMENNRSVASVVYVPYLGKMYLAWRGGGAFLKEGVAADSDAEYSYGQIVESMRRLPVESARHEPPGSPCPGRTSRPNSRSISRNCERAIPIWRSWSRAAPISFVCWRKARWITIFGLLPRMNGILRRGS